MNETHDNDVKINGGNNIEEGTLRREPRVQLDYGKGVMWMRRRHKEKEKKVREDKDRASLKVIHFLLQDLGAELSPAENLLVLNAILHAGVFIHA